MNLKFRISLVIALAFCCFLNAQPREELVKVIIAPNHTDWTYDVGEQAEFSISVLRNNIPLKDVAVDFKIETDPGYREIQISNEGRKPLKNGRVTLKTKKIKTAGFLRCTASVEVDGKTYSSYTTVGFSPDKIKPTTSLPEDFEAFWDKGKADLAEVPINPVLTLMPERCTDKVNVYHVQIDNIHGKIFGVLCVPKKEGKYPAILNVPGAGIRPYYGRVDQAEEGFVSFTIGIHGIPVNLEQSVYSNLMEGALRSYWTTNLDDKDNAYFRRVYLGCVRAVDFIEGLDSFDGETIAVTGGSQGGALSIITASLDDRIDYLAAFYPALSDLTGFLHDRAGGWPQMFTEDYTNKSEKIEVSKYFDVVNFARFVKVKGWYSWGYNDNVCPPASMYSAYNLLSAEKELHIFQESQHWTFPEQREMKSKWLFQQLKSN